MIKNKTKQRFVQNRIQEKYFLGKYSDFNEVIDNKHRSSIIKSVNY